MEWQVGQWVEVIRGMEGCLRVGHVNQIERITNIGTIKLLGSGDCWDASRFKPFTWQVGKTYRTTLEGVTATINIIDDYNVGGIASDNKGVILRWDAATGMLGGYKLIPRRVPHLLPFLADEPSEPSEPSEPEPTLTERFAVGQLGMLWGVFDRSSMMFARFSGREVAEDAIRYIDEVYDELAWWRIEDGDLPEAERTGDAQPKSRYHRTIKGVTIDLYDLAEAYGITDHAQFHAMKKIIMAGDRGYKDRDQDLQEAIDAIQRAIKLGKGGAE